MAENIDMPWIVGGDFNCIQDYVEKLLGLIVNQQEVMDFDQCINNWTFSEIRFTGISYT